MQWYDKIKKIYEILYNTVLKFNNLNVLVPW